MSQLRALSDEEFAEKLSECIAGGEQEPLRHLWAQLDDRAQSVLAVQIGFYVGRNADKEVKAINDRSEQNRLIARELKKEIKSLQNAQKATAQFESLIFGNPDPIPGGRRPFEPRGRPPFSSLLAFEGKRLSGLLRDFERESTMKRFGRSDKHYWLLFAQEFILIWSRQCLGKTLKLSPEHLAALIDCASEAIGNTDSDPSSVAKVAKAVYYFRRNPRNQFFVEMIPWLVTRLVPSTPD
jgi:hypothetical protein